MSTALNAFTLRLGRSCSECAQGEEQNHQREAEEGQSQEKDKQKHGRSFALPDGQVHAQPAPSFATSVPIPLDRLNPYHSSGLGSSAIKNLRAAFVAECTA
jgi:hypothetical protein